MKPWQDSGEFAVVGGDASAVQLPPSTRWRLRAIILIGLALAAMATMLAWDFTRASAQQELLRATEKSVVDLRQRASQAAAVIEGYQGLIHSVDEIDGDQFRSFAEDSLSRHSYFLEVGYYPLVLDSNRHSFESAQHGAGLIAGIVDGADFTGKRPKYLAAAQRESYFPLLFKDLGSEDRSIFGFDYLAIPGAPELGLRAARQGDAVISRPRIGSKNDLVADIAVAVYDGHRLPSQVEMRWPKIQGLVVASLSIDELLAGIGEARSAPEVARGWRAAQRHLQHWQQVMLPGSQAHNQAVTRRTTVEGVDVSAFLLTRVGTLGQERTLILQAVQTIEEGRHVFEYLERREEIAFGDAQLEVVFRSPLLVNFENVQLAGLVLLNSLGMVMLAYRVARSASVRKVLNRVLAGKNVEIEKINAGLEGLVAERTDDLRTANLEISEMLDHLHDAVLIIDETGRILPRHSPAATEVLGVEKLEGRMLAEVLWPKGSASHEVAAHLTALEFALGADDFQWAMSEPEFLRAIQYRCAAAEASSAPQELRLDYAPLLDQDGCVSRILVVIRDETQLLRLQAEAAEQERHNQRMVGVLLELVDGEPSELERSLAEIERRFVKVREQLERTSVDQVSFDAWSIACRELHTIKGNARAIGAFGLSQSIHELESQVLAAREERAASDMLHAAMVENEQLIAFYLQAAHRFLGRSHDGKHAAGYAQLVRAMQACGSALKVASAGEAIDVHVLGNLMQSVQSGQAISMLAVASAHETVMQDLASSRGKVLQTGLEMRGELRDVFVDASMRCAMDEIFIHGMRNAVDHGLETPETRLASDKPLAGRIWLETHYRGDALICSLCDDGRGIDFSRLRQKFLESALPGTTSPTNAELCEMVFIAGVTQRDVADEWSGRGIGLEAVRAGLAQHGIACWLESEPDQGTRLCLSIPLHHILYLQTQEGEVMLPSAFERARDVA